MIFHTHWSGEITIENKKFKEHFVLRIPRGPWGYGKGLKIPLGYISLIQHNSGVSSISPDINQIYVVWFLFPFAWAWKKYKRLSCLYETS